MFRVRRSVGDRTDAVVTMVGSDRVERVLSLDGLLETRAFIETVGHLDLLLSAAGASLDERRTARKLLATTGIDTTRDQYWGVLALLSAEQTVDAMVDVLSEIANDAYFAGWFALHPDAPGVTRDIPLEDHPLFRFVVALQLRKRVRTADDMPVEGWPESVFERLQHEVQGRELGLLLKDHAAAIQHLAQNLIIRGQEPLSGLAATHVKYLSDASATCLQARLNSGAKWTDKFACPPNHNPAATVTGIAECPQDVRKAARTLHKARRLLRQTSTSAKIVIETAKTLFD